MVPHVSHTYIISILSNFLSFVLPSALSAGRIRNACLILADVALMHLKMGRALEAYHLLEHAAMHAEAEGWCVPHLTQGCHII